jgi:vacuolar-type H+-ATPase subunit F/Vma7
LTPPARTVRVLGSPAAGAGFRLAGLAPDETADPAEGARRLVASLDAPDAGVVLVEEAIYRALSDAGRRRLARRPLPLVVPFPGPAWAAREEGPEAFVAELLRQAIGYRVRLG